MIGLAMLWLVQIVEFWGWYVIFESANITMWSLYGLLLILCMVIVFSGTRITLQNHPRIRNSVRGIVLLIPVLGILSFSNKTYYRGLFAEFYEIDRTEFKVVFKPQPSDARQFEIRTSSNEVRNLVKDKATYDANHHYMPNVKLKINMTFKRINTIELYELADQELEQPVQRQLKQLKGATEFLK